MGDASVRQRLVVRSPGNAPRSALTVHLVLALLLGLWTLPAAATDPDLDLSVGWIARLPRVDSPWDNPDPTVIGWPAQGQVVTWVANVRNLWAEALPGVGYRWSLDGAVVETGTVTLPPAAVTTVELPWPWTFDRHRLTFEIDPDDRLGEAERRNNRLMVFTDAAAVGFYVEQSFWDAMRDPVTEAGIGARTFDDWVQRRIRQFNEMAALARYPETPNGVRERWRIDAIHLVDDGSLPLVDPGELGAPLDHAGQATTLPNLADRTVDMMWGFPAVAATWYANPTGMRWSLMMDSLDHELGHARGLIDVYAWNLSEPGDQIDLFPRPRSTEHGWFWQTPAWGLMNTEWGFIDRYSAVWLDRVAGKRAVGDNVNPPDVPAPFLNDLPQDTRVRPVTPDGTTFPNAVVRVFRASPEIHPEVGLYAMVFDGTPDIVAHTDADGYVDLGHNPFSDGEIFQLAAGANGIAIVQVDDGTASHWGYLEVWRLNLASWQGHTETADLDLEVDAPICFCGIGPDMVTPRFEALVTDPMVAFSWPGSSGHSYELWIAADGGMPRLAATEDVRRSRTVIRQVPVRGRRIAWWILDHDPTSETGCPPKRSVTFTFDLDAGPPPPRRPFGRLESPAAGRSHHPPLPP